MKPRPPIPSDGLFGSEPIIGRMSLLKFVVSASTALASAWPLTTQTFSPNRLASLCTGSTSRIWPSSGVGSSPTRRSGIDTWRGNTRILDRFRPPLRVVLLKTRLPTHLFRYVATMTPTRPL